MEMMTELTIVKLREELGFNVCVAPSSVRTECSLISDDGVNGGVVGIDDGVRDENITKEILS